MDAFEQWKEKARGTPIEREVERRGIKLKRVGVEHVGPCPKCGGDDRFSINTKEQVFNCRGCGVGGDVIKLVEHLDGCGFIGACAKLTGESPPKGNGKDPNDERTIVVAEYTYLKEDGSTAFVVERVEFQNADGTFVVNKDGKRKKSFRQKRPDPNRPGGWAWNIDDVAPVPYRLLELTEATLNNRVDAIGVFLGTFSYCCTRIKSGAGVGGTRVPFHRCLLMTSL
jgi:CHC2-type zinc finger protein